MFLRNIKKDEQEKLNFRSSESAKVPAELVSDKKAKNIFQRIIERLARNQVAINPFITDNNFKYNPEAQKNTEVVVRTEYGYERKSVLEKQERDYLLKQYPVLRDKNLSLEDLRKAAIIEREKEFKIIRQMPIENINYFPQDGHDIRP